MAAAIPIPKQGEGIRASWGAAVAQTVNGIMPCGTSGTLMRNGPGWQGAEPTPNNRRSRSASSSAPGCWSIATDPVDDTKGKMFVNRYYQIGGDLYELEYEDAYPCAYISNFVMQGDLEEGEEYTDDDLPFVALSVSMDPDDFGTPTVVGFASFAELKAACAEAGDYLRPLYKLTHNGGVAIDLRNMPQASSMEMEVTS